MATFARTDRSPFASSTTSPHWRGEMSRNVANGNPSPADPLALQATIQRRRRLLMKATALKTTLSGGALALALFGDAALFSAPASAAAVNNAVYRADSSSSVPSSLVPG